MSNLLLTKRKIQQATTGYIILIVILLVIGGYYSYKNLIEYQNTKTAQENEQVQLNQLKVAAEKSQKDFIALQEDLSAKNIGTNQSIEKIFPSTEDFTNLARGLDKYFINTTKGANPMFLSDLRFNQANTTGKEYGILPFSVTLNGDEDGFKQLLNYVEQSGDIVGQSEDPNNKSRLLDIASISLNFQNETKDDNQNDSASATDITNTTETTGLGKAKTISATLNLNAFFQKPLEDKTTNK